MPEQIAKLRNSGPSVADGLYPEYVPLKNPFAMTARLIFLCAGLSAVSLVGCGGGGSKGDFTLEVAPATLTVVPGGPAQTFTVGASPLNGFKGSVALTVGSLPAGVTATPMTLTITPGALMQV